MHTLSHQYLTKAGLTKAGLILHDFQLLVRRPYAHVVTSVQLDRLIV